MSRHMLEAECFQESLPGLADVYMLHETEGYFVPYMKGEKLEIRTFLRSGSSIYTADLFKEQYPRSAQRNSSVFDRPASYVYFIADDRHIKIGISKHPRKRLASLQTGHPVRLRILATIPGAAAEEFELHCRFRKHRVHGEWFRDCDEIRAFVREACGGDPAANDNAAFVKMAADT